MQNVARLVFKDLLKSPFLASLLKHPFFVSTNIKQITFIDKTVLESVSAVHKVAYLLENTNILMSFCLHSPYKKTLEDNGKSTIMRHFPSKPFSKASLSFK